MYHVQCQSTKLNSRYLPIKYTGLSGFFSHNFTYDEIRELGTDRHFLHVEAVEQSTKKNVTLIGVFRVFGEQEHYFCSLNMINTATRPIPQGGSVEFISVGMANSFECNIGKNWYPCKFN